MPNLPPWAPYAIGAAVAAAVLLGVYLLVGPEPAGAAGAAAVALAAQQAAKSRKQTRAKVAKAERAMDAEPPKRSLKARVRDGAGSV